MYAGIALLLGILCLLGSLSGCKRRTGPEDGTEPSTGTPSPAGPASAQTLTLPFAKRDLLNPYLAVSRLNLEIAQLVYEGLFTLDEHYAAEAILAQEIRRETTLRWVLTLKSGRVFHTGAPVTAADVVYSFQKAKASQTYKERLASVASAGALPDGTVQLNLSRANANVAACLDFPVIPAGSSEQGKLSAAENGVFFNLQTTPPGTGRYRLALKEGNYSLSYDKAHPGEAPRLTEIQLYGVSDTAALPYGLEMGNFQFFYDDLSSGEVVRVGASTAHIPTTNFLYLCFRFNRGVFTDAKLRQAVAACLNKQALVSECWHGYARVTDTPFPPEWEGVNAKEYAQPYDPAAARKLLDDCGWKTVENGVRTKGGRQLALTMIVSKDNAFRRAAAKSIRSQLAEFGIGVTIKELSLEELRQQVQLWNFDIYLGEVKLTPDLSLAPLLQAGGAAAAGINIWGRVGSYYGQMQQGLVTPAQFMEAFREETPFVPLAYRDGMAAVSRRLHAAFSPRPDNLFADIVSWY
jgi:peptide/nickel transport system substrate-binding protein